MVLCCRWLLPFHTTVSLVRLVASYAVNSSNEYYVFGQMSRISVSSDQEFWRWHQLTLPCVLMSVIWSSAAEVRWWQHCLHASSQRLVRQCPGHRGRTEQPTGQARRCLDSGDQWSHRLVSAKPADLPSSSVWLRLNSLPPGEKKKL